MLLIIGLLYKSDMTQWWQQYYQQAESQVLTTAIPVEQVKASVKNEQVISSPAPDQIVPEQSVSAEVHINDVPAIMQSLTTANKSLLNDTQSNEASNLNISESKTPIDEKVNAKEQPKVDLNSSWYSKQADTSLVIQLLAVTQQKVSDEFIAQYNLQEQTHTYQTIRNNKMWWVVTFGNFTSLNEAKSAMVSLPAEVRKNKPFYKKISKIKQEIALVDQ